MPENLQNWAQNFSYHAENVHRPASVEELQNVVRNTKRVKALGSRHSFNQIADTSGTLISMENLNKVVSLDRENRQVTVEGGIKYGELCAYLATENLALHNLASLPHISVAGACATATHGSGDANGNLSTAVSKLEIVKADGSLVTLEKGKGADFEGAVVGIGALGVVVRVTLELLPYFEISQTVYEHLPLANLEAHFDEITSSAYSVSLFTDWQENSVNQVWLKSFSTDEPKGPTFFGATIATEKLHPIKSMSPVNCTDQLGVPGPWHDRLQHFRMDFTPSSGEELQSEFLIPRQHAVDAIIAVASLKAKIAPLLQISEIRTMAADDLWLSPSYQQACVGIHFTWKKDWESVRLLLPEIESVLSQFDARPHWGKLFTMSGERVQSLYSRMDDFRELAKRFDPEGKFRNEFLSSIL